MSVYIVSVSFIGRGNQCIRRNQIRMIRNVLYEINIKTDLVDVPVGSSYFIEQKQLILKGKEKNKRKDHCK